MNSILKKSIDRVVRGMAFWIAYTNEISFVKFTEAEAVGKIAKILKLILPTFVKIRREVEYKSVCSDIKSIKRADLGIFVEDKCQCLIEVKLSENINGGYKTDIKN